MAKADYFCCTKCDDKVIFDGVCSVQDELSYRFGIPEEDGWLIHVVCHKCSDDGHIHIIPPEVTTL